MKKILLFLLLFHISLFVSSQTRRIGEVGTHNYETGKTYPDTPCYCTYESLGNGEHQIDFAISLTNGLVFTVKYISQNENEDYIYKVTGKLSFDGFLKPEKEYIISDKPLREANQIAFKDMSGNWKGWIASNSEASTKEISKPDKKVESNNKKSVQIKTKSVDNEKEILKWSERTTNKFNSLNNEYRTYWDSINHTNKVFDWWEERLHSPVGEDTVWYKNEVESITTALTMYYKDSIIVDSLIGKIVYGNKLSDKYTKEQIKKIILSRNKVLKEKYGY